MNMLSQLFGGMTQIWLNVAFIVSVFTVLAFRPAQIRDVKSFKTACALFALSLIAPGIGMLLVSLLAPTPAGPSRGSALGEMTLSLMIVNLVGPVLFAIAFLTAANALMPTARREAPASGTAE